MIFQNTLLLCKMLLSLPLIIVSVLVDILGCVLLFFRFL